MDTAIGTFQADKEAAFTPKLGEVKPIDIVSLKRRKTDEKIVTDLAKAVARDGGYLHPPAVRDEGEGWYQLIHGHHRLEAWKRCRGEQTPIRANIYPPGRGGHRVPDSGLRQVTPCTPADDRLVDLLEQIRDRDQRAT